MAPVLSFAAIAGVGRGIAGSVATLRAALIRFRANRDNAPPLGGDQAGTNSTELVGLHRGIHNMYRRVARREQMLKKAYEAAQRESAASRNLAQQSTRSQRIARIGSWERERVSNTVVCSGE